MKTVEIWSEYITMGKLLKLTDIIASGAEAKEYLAENMPLVNNEPDNRRGRKIRPGDVVTMGNGRKYKVVAKS